MSFMPKKLIHFVFSADPLRAGVVEEMFAEQLVALENAGFSTSVWSDVAVHRRKLLRNVSPDSKVVYRGWMLNASLYAQLMESIVASSAVPFTPASAYLAAHHLPNGYPLIREFTPETRVLALEADFEAELRAIGWDAYFIKDYVKSLKTSRGSIIHDPSQITAVVEEMKQFRGEIEGGLCVRRVETFEPETERRYFVLEGKAYSGTGERVPDLVDTVAGRIPSRFFSVDVIRRTDGVLRIVEIGDGQVSDLVGWSADAFAEMRRESCGAIG